MSPLPFIRATAFYVALALFGVWAFGFNAASFLFSWLPANERTEGFFQRLIQRQMAAYLWFLRTVGVVRVEYRGWERLAHGPAVIVANHPGMLDAFYLIARVPRAICIFKPAIGRNPVLAAAARRAGYLANDSGIGLVRGALERIGRGASLVVFPEGTRTPQSGVMDNLRPGFAAIARRAGVPVQCVRITTDRKLLGKGEACWRLPTLPVRVVVEAGPCVDPAAPPSTGALVRQVDAWFRAGQPRAGLTQAVDGRTLSVA